MFTINQLPADVIFWDQGEQKELGYQTDEHGTFQLLFKEHGQFCRKNRLCIIVDCIALCLSAGIYRVQES
jgi:hypothetical protein